MNKKEKAAVAGAVLVSAVMICLIVAAAVGGRLGLIRLSLWLPLPDWLRAILWGWC